jgi:hypothetical protein
MSSDYLKKFAISQTAIKEWRDLSPQKWHDTWVTKTRKRPQRTSTDFGSYLDCLMFTPQLLDKRFVVSDVSMPSEKVTLIINEVYAHLLELNNNAAKMNEENKGNKQFELVPYKKLNLEDKDLVVSFCVKHDHYKNKPDQAYNDVLKKGTDYFEFLKGLSGRRIITPDEKKDADDLKKILLEDKTSKGFFIAKKGCEVVFQQAIYSDFDVDYDNVQILPLKGMLDIIHINNTRKEIREVDLKCTEDAFLFDSAIGPVRRFDYPGQHSFYDYLLRDWITKYKDGIYKDYSVMNPLNVVIDRDAKVPYHYEYNQTDLYIKRFGIENTKIKGWNDILNEIAFHFDCGDWTRPMQHIKNGKMLINVFSKR